MDFVFFSDFYYYTKNILSNMQKKINPYVNSVPLQFSFYFTLYVIVCYVIYTISTVFRHQLSRSKYFDSYAKRVLVVIAHPDDECMFFGPLIVNLMKSRKYVIYILCLSSGDAEKKGCQRKAELWNSCNVLGISAENVFLCCSSLRMDGHQYIWKSDTIASLITDYVETYDIDTVVTFDKYGVSGHSNHISLFGAVNFLSMCSLLPTKCRVFVLDSVGLVRKYSSFIDAVLSLIISQNVFILSPNEHNIVKQAMRMHKTQLVWFRKLYMCFSRYTYINTVHEIPR